MHHQEQRNVFPKSDHSGIRFLSVYLLVCLCAACFCWPTKTLAADFELLKQYGIERNQESLAKFFESLNPEGEIVSTTKALIAEMGAEDFRQREAAMLRLLAMPQLPIELLKQATTNDDPEIQWRAKILLSKAGNQSRQLIREALLAITEKKIVGLCEAVLSCTQYYDDVSLQQLAQEALITTVQKSDADTLRKAVKDEDARVRAIAYRGLASALGEDASEDLRGGLDDAVERVRLYTAFELAKRGDRQVLSAFIDLLSAEDLKIRSQSVQVLRSMTGEQFGFAAYGSAEQRDAATKSWRTWLEENQQTAELNSDVRLSPARIGRILVCYYDTNLVVEYDENHKEVWSTSVTQPWGCQGLPNGHRLITSYSGNCVIEYDGEGNEVWRATVSGNPVQAQRLDNGNTLIALYTQREIVEISPKSERVASIPIPGQANHVFRTDDGHTLVSCRDGAGVIEFDAKGKEVTRFSGGRPFSARRLDNGNTLIADSAVNSILEIDPNKKTVWKKSALANPLDGVRMDNGNTLIADQTGVIEVDDSGATVWSDTRGHAIRISYY